MRIHTSDPLATVHGSARFEAAIKKQGVYRLRLERQGEALAERSIRITFVDPQDVKKAG